MSSVIVSAISRATLWKKKISRAARIECAKGRPRSSLSLRARSSRGEGSLIVTTSSSSVGVLDIELKTFVAQMEQRGDAAGLPGFVMSEFERYLLAASSPTAL